MLLFKEEKNTNMNENGEYAIELFESYKRLCDNSDFNKLIKEGFVTKFSDTQLNMLHMSSAVDNIKEKAILNNLVAVSAFKDWLRMVEQFGEYHTKLKKDAEQDNGEITSLESEVGIE
jgi:hypothetical protein